MLTLRVVVGEAGMAEKEIDEMDFLFLFANNILVSVYYAYLHYT